MPISERNQDVVRRPAVATLEDTSIPLPVENAPLLKRLQVIDERFVKHKSTRP
jgi:hypothetical protein